MRGKRLLWQIYPTYLIITILSLLAITWYSSSAIKEFYRTEIRSDLEARAYLVEESLRIHLSSGNSAAIDALCKKSGNKSATRITVILPDGKVIGDTKEYPEKMDNHADRPEIRSAFKGEAGSSVRFSNTLQKNMMYVAIPLKKQNKTIAVVRMSISLAAIDNALMSIYFNVFNVGLVIAGLAASISLIVSYRISRPLEELKEGAEKFASGELDQALKVEGAEEIASLADTMNNMASQLDERIRTITRERNEQDAILSSMVEGVIAIDGKGRVININKAAAQMLASNPETIIGKGIQEAVRNTALQDFISEALKSSEPKESDLVFRNDEERFLQVHSTTLPDVKHKKAGAVIVLEDVTRIRKLEKMRSEFVGNVSHELKTPITSIKGFVETLQDGAINKREDAERFLNIISRQADRLNAIIEDLLLLSRIEQDIDKSAIRFEGKKLKKLLNSAIELCLHKAKEKEISVELLCQDDIVIRSDSSLIEQCFVNLIDNAIKYSEKGCSVQVKVVQENNEVAIDVIDNGCGISHKHHNRLFERFYRVDKGRSRELGGTGLGLAIAKHIVQIHNGTITLESEPGKGSKFTVHLPSAG